MRLAWCCHAGCGGDEQKAVIWGCSTRAIFNHLPFAELQCCHISSAYLKINIPKAKHERLWIFRVFTESDNFCLLIFKTRQKLFWNALHLKICSLCLTCIKDTTRAGSGITDYKLDGGGEARQLTSLRAPCRCLPKSTFCPVTLQEQDHDRKVGSDCAQWLMKGLLKPYEGRIDASFDFGLPNMSAAI